MLLDNLAKQYRPKTFEQLLAQESVSQFFLSTLDKGVPGQVFLFIGPRGTGKTSTARILSRSLLCETGPRSIACLHCDQCQSIDKNNHPDLKEIDGASYTSINDIKKLQENALFLPIQARYKIFIIDEVHMLSQSAFNALLKTLEEPAHHLIFIFATTEEQKIPETVKSRCQKFYFQLFSPHMIVHTLHKVLEKFSFSYDPLILNWIAQEARGSLRDAYFLLEKILHYCQKDTYIDLKFLSQYFLSYNNDLRKIFKTISCAQSSAEILIQIHPLFNQVSSWDQLANDLLFYVRDLFLLSSHLPCHDLIHFPRDCFDDTSITFLSSEEWEQAWQLCLQFHLNYRYINEPRYTMEALFIKIYHLKGYVSLQQIKPILSRLLEQTPLSHQNQSHDNPPQKNNYAEKKINLKPNPKPNPNPDLKPNPKPNPNPDLKPNPNPDPNPKPNPNPNPNPKPNPDPNPNPNPKPEPEPEPEPEPQVAHTSLNPIDLLSSLKQEPIILSNLFLLSAIEKIQKIKQENTLLEIKIDNRLAYYFLHYYQDILTQFIQKYFPVFSTKRLTITHTSNSLLNTIVEQFDKAILLD